MAFNFDNAYQHLTLANSCKAGAWVLSAHMIHVGLWAFTSPPGLCNAFGMRLDGRPYNSSGASAATDGPKASASGAVKGADDEQNFWPLLFAPREVGFGVMLATFGAMGEWKAAGITMAVVAGLLATTDGVAAGLYGKGGWSDAVTSHGLPAIVLGGISYVLIKG